MRYLPFVFLVLLPTGAAAQVELSITPDSLKTECLITARSENPAQGEDWWNERCDCFAGTATAKMIAIIEQTGQRETYRTWLRPKSEAYVDCKIVG